MAKVQVLVRWMALLVGLACVFGSTSLAWAEPEPVRLDAEHGVSSVFEHALTLRDPEGELSLDDVRSPAWAAEFQDTQKPFEFGFTSDAYWFRFDIDNASTHTGYYYLDSFYALTDEITIYQIEEQGVLSEQMGDRMPFDARKVRVLSFGHEVLIPPGERQTFYVRVRTTSSFSFPLRVYTAKAYAQYNHNRMLVIGVFYGIVLGLFAYNLFLFAITRERDYFYYLGFVLFNWLFSASLDGTTYWALPDFVYWQSRATYMYICAGAIFALKFSRSYLRTQETLPRLHKAFVVSEYLFIAYAVLVLLVEHRILSVVVLLSLNLALFSIATSALVRALRGDKSARLYAAGWSVYISTIFFGVLTSTGVIPLNEYLPYAHKVGVSCEIILLSMALANRITALKDAEREAKSQAHQAHAASKAKSEFLAKMSHEIRTPMNGVLGMTTLLSDTRLSNQQQMCVDTITTSGQALLTVINDILDYSKIEAGKMDIESTPFELESMIDACCATFSLKACEQKVPLVVNIASKTPGWLVGDPSRIRQILINLLSNAYKFTKRGQVELKVSSKPITAEKHLILFEVRDTGVGIAPAALARLFESFSQEDSSTTRKYGGSGLGLAICKQLVELMSGKIGVESEKGKGSHFWFAIPLGVASSQAKWAARRVGDRLRRLQALYVGASSPVEKAMLGHLRYLELSTQHCETVLALDAYLQKGQRPSVVVVEEALQGESAIRLCQRMQEAWGHDAPPILVSLPPHETEQRRGLARLGNVFVLEYPRTPKALRQQLMTLFATDRELNETTRLPALGQMQPMPSTDFSKLRVLVAEDHEINQKVISGMLAKLGVRPEFAGNGAQAVDMFVQREGGYDLILMDCEMPEKDGFEACQEIRAWAKTKDLHPRIVALSAHVLPEHRERAAHVGMDDFLSKPVSMKVLRAALDQSISLDPCA